MSGEADYWRQLKIFNPNNYKDIRIAMIGAGSVGSFTALVLAKMGLQDITVWDHDKVENHNIPNQLYPPSSIGQFKTEALSQVVWEMADSRMMFYVKKWVDESLDTYDIILAFPDDMKTRKAIWDACKYKPHRAFIDARMGGEVMRIYTVDPMKPSHIEGYEATLYDDKKAENLPCSAKTIVYNMAGIAGFIANNIKKVLTGDSELYNEIIFDYKCMMMEKRRWGNG